MKLPILIVDGFDITVHPSQAHVESYLEIPDVDDGVRAFDAKGILLDVKVVEYEGKKGVSVREHLPLEDYSDELHQILVGNLSYSGNLKAELEKLSNIELIKLVGKKMRWRIDVVDEEWNNVENLKWNSIISSLPSPHFLQTYEWGQVKAKYGWTPLYAVWNAEGSWKVESDPALLATFHSPVAAALILKRQILRNGFAARLSILYSPKGPMLDWANEALRNRVLNDLQPFAKKQGAIFLKMDPDVMLGTGVPASEEDVVDNNGQLVMNELKRRGWEYASDQIQFKNTVLIDLNPTEEEMLARMKQKTRYNVRLAEKKGVVIRVGTKADLLMLYKMYAETSVRDGFVIRDEGYYQTVWNLFMNSTEPTCEPLIAEVNDEPVAAIFVFYFAARAYYVYGMSRDKHREKMPTYLLQWEAMKRAKAKGCTMYDLWGAPDVFNESDSMWGVYRFKEGLGGKVIRTLGAWDFAPTPLWYKLYSEIIPRALDVMRARGKSKTKQSLGGA